MLEILQFIFSDFWIFCGTVILIYVSGASVSMIAEAFGKVCCYSLISMGIRNKKRRQQEGKG